MARSSARCRCAGRTRFHCNPATGATTVEFQSPEIGGVAEPFTTVPIDGLSYGAAWAGGPAGGGTLFRLAPTGTPPALDSDTDGLSNIWETTYGLDPFSSAGDAGATGDPDHDGRTNAQELADGTHPRGTVTRYFAEGATGAFFHTRFDLGNPQQATPAIVRVRFLTDSRRDGRAGRDRAAVVARVDRSGDAARPRQRDVLDDRRSGCHGRRRSDDDLGRVGLRQPPRDGPGRALDDVVLRRRIDVGRLLAVLPAAEPAGHRRDRHGALPSTGGRADRTDLHAAAAQPHHDPRRLRRTRAREHGRLGGRSPRRRRSSPNARCT